MRFYKFLPKVIVRDYVKYFWVLEKDSIDKEILDFKILPDGVPSIIFIDHLQEKIQCDYDLCSHLYVYGQYNKFTNQKIKGSFRIIGVYLQPMALKALFNIDASELYNCSLPLEDLVSKDILELLINTNTTKDKITILSDFIESLILKTNYSTLRINFIINSFEQGKSLQEIQNDMKISERSLERFMKIHIGLTPKMFSRIIRFQKSLDNLRVGNKISLTEIAYDNEYYDQAHFNKDFKFFVGYTPSAYLKASDEQLLNFPLMRL
ncbi:helix-turn-helix domain-containing protein [Myroides injenensis]|uniref:helix-turn-helix domain-containing protein n=1 Tax=Myroides injenensis TaxID=1183151 RepID=UPI002270DA9C|nr:helix-turn-helix domain-containing protein [Myroides injenensis]